MKKGSIFLLIVMLTTFTAKGYELGVTENQAMDGKPAFCSMLTYGVEGGLTLFNQRFSYEGEANNDNNNIKPGFQLAATVLYPVMDALFILAMLEFTMKGTIYKFSSGNYSSTDRLSIFYLQFPILLAYTFATIQEYTLMALFGPYFSLGLWGKYNYEYTSDGQSDSGSDKLEWGKENDLRRADVGLIFGAMVVRGLWTFRVAYQLGLKNVHPIVDSESGRYNRGLSLTIGRRFTCNL